MVNQWAPRGSEAGARSAACGVEWDWADWDQGRVGARVANGTSICDRDRRDRTHGTRAAVGGSGRAATTVSDREMGGQTGRYRQVDGEVCCCARERAGG
jgi:hypothetical protein